MKIGLFLALLVLLASTNVFGERSGRVDSGRTETDPNSSNWPGGRNPDDNGSKNQGGSESRNNEGFEDPQDGHKGDSTTVRPKKLDNKPGKDDDSHNDRPDDKPGNDDDFHNDRPDNKPGKDDDSHNDRPDNKPGNDDDSHKDRPDVKSSGTSQPRPMSASSVHVSGKIYLLKYDSSAVGSVQYDLNGAHLVNGAPAMVESRSPWSQEYIARGSRVTLYVSTTKTNDRKLAFAEYPIQYVEDHFPISFNVDIDLPNQQRGLLERAEITLYFFAYVTNPESHTDTFLPYGSSQILLQGTNQLVQKLIVNVRASGIEVAGLFRGRFGSLFIQSGTSFQVYIVSEESLSLVQNGTYDSVAQLTITNVPAMFPVPFSLLVQYQALKTNTKYYAIAYSNEHGSRYLLTQQPVLIINEQKLLVTPQITFTVIPFPFFLQGTVTRSMPSFFTLQPNSTLSISLHEVGSKSRDIIYTLSHLVALPQYFQLNVSESTRFNPSKNYEISAFITDGKNRLYMTTLQPLPLLDELTKLVVPVDDFLYYVRARLQSSSGEELRYMPGSTCRAFISDSPETPTDPIAYVRFDSVPEDFREFSIQVQATSILRGHNYYLIMMIEANGVITHVSKTLLISNSQAPPLVIQMPVLSLNTISGVVFDIENRPAQWSSSSFATLYLVTGDKDIVQAWKIHLENDFPVRFEVQVDFSRLRADRIYRLQSSIETGRNELEYKPAGSVLVLNPGTPFITDVRVPVRNVKTFQLVNGLIYINDVHGPLPEKSVILVQLSSSPSLTNPSVVEEIEIKVDGRNLPVEFTMNLPLSKINLNAVYYFLVRYTVRDTLVVPVTQAFAFSPRNEQTVVLTISKTRQVLITGQVTATGNPLDLPLGSSVHLYITDNIQGSKSLIYSETTMAASLNSIYEYSMYIDSVTLEKRLPLYLVAEIIYNGKVILRMPRPSLLQLTPGAEWNINLVIDLPTLLVGKIISMGSREDLRGEFDVYIEIVKAGTSVIVQTVRIRLDATLPQDYRIQLKNELFIQYSKLEARAVIRNCKEQIIYKSGAAVEIHVGVNVGIDLSVVLTDRSKLTELTVIVDETAPTNIGNWITSITGVDTNSKFGLVMNSDDKRPEREF